MFKCSGTFMLVLLHVCSEQIDWQIGPLYLMNLQHTLHYHILCHSQLQETKTKGNTLRLLKLFFLFQYFTINHTFLVEKLAEEYFDCSAQRTQHLISNHKIQIAKWLTKLCGPTPSPSRKVRNSNSEFQGQMPFGTTFVYEYRNGVGSIAKYCMQSS